MNRTARVILATGGGLDTLKGPTAGTGEAEYRIDVTGLTTPTGADDTAHQVTVELEADAADVGRHTLCLLHVEIGHDDRSGAFRCESSTQRFPDTAPASRHKDELASNVHVVSLLRIGSTLVPKRHSHLSLIADLGTAHTTFVP